MAMNMQAESRNRLNTSGLRNLRKSGRLPGIVFGNQSENEMIHISLNDFKKWMRQGSSGMISLEFEGKRTMSVLLEGLQRDPITRDVIHVDFQQLRSDTVVRTRIPVKFKGVPVGTKQGGIVQIQQAYIEVEALPRDLPDEFEYDISEFLIGGSVLVADVELPSGVTAVSEPNECLLSVVK